MIKTSFLTSFTDKYLNYLFALLICSFSFSLYSIYNSPLDYQQGNAVKIMYIHVPSAWLALMIYSSMAILSICSFIYKNPIFNLSSVSLAPIGCIFALITLITGSIWGKPIWGTWWIWDARLTSMLILFFLYISYISLYSSYGNILQGSKISSFIAIIGFINIPIIKFSVDMWNSLHQKASIIRQGGISIAPEMQPPLFSMFAFLIIISLIIYLLRVNKFLLFLKRKRELALS